MPFSRGRAAPDGLTPGLDHTGMQAINGAVPISSVSKLIEATVMALKKGPNGLTANAGAADTAAGAGVSRSRSRRISS